MTTASVGLIAPRAAGPWAPCVVGFNLLDPTLTSLLFTPRRVGRRGAKMMTPVRYMFLAFFIVVRTPRAATQPSNLVSDGPQTRTDQSPLHP